MAEEDQEKRALIGEGADLGRNGHDSSKFKVQSSKFKVKILLKWLPQRTSSRDGQVRCAPTLNSITVNDKISTLNFEL
jgi:hypothetical protein